LTEKVYLEAFEAKKELLAVCSGNAFFGKFGEPPFSPVPKKEALSLSPAQRKQNQVFQSRIINLQYRYIPREETSFCMISFPAPEIGENYESIFADFFEINLLSSEEWEGIQGVIINALDKAEKVVVKGKAPNETDITVNMQKLFDPSKQTNFVNCGADVNIPVGEVFTSPKLTGTEGLLHATEVFLGGLRYKDLKLWFKDGFISEYSAGGFETQEEGKNFVAENLLMPHETLQ
jgi:leucyl aminopeptidase (aminopeptidase T)